MKTTYKNMPLLKKGYPTLFWIASAGKASTVPVFSTGPLLKCSNVLAAKPRPLLDGIWSASTRDTHHLVQNLLQEVDSMYK